MSAQTVQSAFEAGPGRSRFFRSRAYAVAEHRLRVRLSEGFEIVLVRASPGMGKSLFLKAMNQDPQFGSQTVYFPRLPAHDTEFLEVVRRRTKSDAAAAPIVLIDDADDLPAEILSLAGPPGGESAPRARFVLACLPSSTSKLVAAASSLGLGIAECVIGRLEDDEVPRFVAHSLALAGEDPRLFTAEALARIAAYALGAPKLVNLLCGKAMIAARLAGEPIIAAAAIEHVAAGIGLAAEPAMPADKPVRFPPPLFIDGFPRTLPVENPDRTVHI